MTPAQLALYYVGLLVMQYYGLPRASGTVSALVTQAIADMIVLQVRAGFSLATATGRQLDCIGELVGLSRNIPGLNPASPEFSLPRYSDAGAGSYVGLARYSGIQPDGHWARYADLVPVYVMTDGQFAELIQFVVAVRASNYSLAALDAIFFEFFGNLVKIVDNGDMTMTYQHSASDPGVLFAIINFLKLLPHPAGVSYSVVTV